MSMRCAGIAIVVATASTLVAPSARADAESDAKDLFDRGRALRTAGDCGRATPLFHKAYELFPEGLGTLRNAAECEESLGRWATARRSWLELGRALMFAHDTRYGGWQNDAEQAASRIEPRVSHLTVEITGTSDAGLVVTVGGAPLAHELLGTALDRDPGRYEVRARLGDREARASVDLATGESSVVHLDFTGARPASATVHAGPGSHAPSSGSPWMPAGVVTLSVGLAALAGMGVAIGVRQDALSSLSSQCPDYATGPCPASLRPTVDRGGTASSAATALAVAGGVLAGAGIVLLVVGATTPHHEAVALRLLPWSVALEGRF